MAQLPTSTPPIALRGIGRRLRHTVAAPGRGENECEVGGEGECVVGDRGGGCEDEEGEGGW